jgi:hypothetical protein
VAVAGTAAELVAHQLLHQRLGMLAEPYSQGRPGALLRTARVLEGVGALGAVVGRRSRTLSVLSGAALVAGSVLTRFGIFQGGVASAKDPKYTVVPQRERAGARA